MKNSDYLKAKKEIVLKLKRSGIDANELDKTELDKMISEHLEEQESMSEMRIALTVIGLCFGLWI
jgi:hypothetical protein